MTIILILSVLMAWAIAEYNAAVYKLYLGGKDAEHYSKKNQTTNKLVHLIGFAMRSIWFLTISYITFISLSFKDAGFIVVLNLNLLWLGYNLIYNFRHGHPWWYLGKNTSSWIDRNLKQSIYAIQLFLLLCTVLWFPIFRELSEGIFNYFVTILIVCLSLYFVIRFYYK